MDEKKIVGVKIFKLDGSTIIFRCSNYEMSRMVDEVRLYREDGSLLAQFFTHNIAGYSVLYEGDVSGNGIEALYMPCGDD